MATGQTYRDQRMMCQAIRQSLRMKKVNLTLIETYITIMHRCFGQIKPEEGDYTHPQNVLYLYTYRRKTAKKVYDFKLHIFFSSGNTNYLMVYAKPYQNKKASFTGLFMDLIKS